MLLYRVGDIDFFKVLSSRPVMELELEGQWANAVWELGRYGFDMEGNVSGAFYQTFDNWLGSKYPSMSEASSYVQMARIAGQLIELGMGDGVAKVIGASIAEGLAVPGGEPVSDIYVDGWLEGGDYGASHGLYGLAIVLDPFGEEQLTKHYWEERYAMRYMTALYWGDLAGWDVYGREGYVVVSELGDRSATGVAGVPERMEVAPDLWDFNGGWIDQSPSRGGYEITIYERAYAEYQGMLYRIPEGYYVEQEGKGATIREGWEPGRMKPWEDIGVEPQFSVESRD